MYSTKAQTPKTPESKDDLSNKFKKNLNAKILGWSSGVLGYQKSLLSQKILRWLGAIMIIAGLILWPVIMFKSGKEKSSVHTNSLGEQSLILVSPLQVCKDAVNDVELGSYRQEATIVVREECMSSLIVRKDPKRTLDIKFQGEGNVDHYIFRNGKYVGILSQLREKNKTWNIDPARDSIRLAGFNGTATARLR